MQFNDTGFKAMMDRTTVVLAGGNSGEVEAAFEAAKTSLEVLIGSAFRLSSVYESAAWGMEGAPPFLNQAWCFNTSLTPESLMQLLLMVERDLGRVRSVGAGYENRLIDLDILLMDDLVQDGAVMLPHPRLHLRNFALLPLQEILPHWVHPVFHVGVSELIDRCPDAGLVVRR